MASCHVRRQSAAARHRVLAHMTQVIDFIQCLFLLQKGAGNRPPRWIKHLARLWAGSAQSYPQLEWKPAKVSSNHRLGGIPSRWLEQCRLSESEGSV
jgi:hypothetical protein